MADCGNRTQAEEMVHKAKLCKQDSEHFGDWGKDQLGIVMSVNILLFTGHYCSFLALLHSESFSILINTLVNWNVLKYKGTIGSESRSRIPVKIY